MVHWLPLDSVPHEAFWHKAGEAQSPVVVQVCKQVAAPAAQRNGAHVPVVPAVHLPAPSHVDPFEYPLVTASHEADTQVVPSGHSSHCPLPSHLPFCWQLDGSSVGHAG